MKTILVTGGAGFIGSHLCKALTPENYVICLDNFFTGSMDNIESLVGTRNFEVVRHDITIPIFLEVDEIYHLACPASPIHYQYNPIKTIKTNILGTLVALGIAKRTKAKILLSSTSEVYGDPVEHPQTEEYWGNVNPIGIRSCYDEGKRAAECLMMDYHRKNNVKIKIARIFNTYGPYMSVCDGRVVSNFIIQALKGDDITIYGDGSQTRSFCYVDDMVSGLIKLMNSKDEITGPINLGNPHEVTVEQLAYGIVNMCESKSKIVYKPLPQDDPTRRQPSIYKALRELDWSPEVIMEDGLQRTIFYFKSKISLDK